MEFPASLRQTFASVMLAGGQETDDTPSKGGRKAGRKTGLGKPQVELQKVAATVTAGVASQVTALRRHVSRVQQKAKEHREARRAGRESRKRGRKQGSHKGKGKTQSAAAELVRQAKEHERALDVRSAIKCYEEAAKLVPHSFEHLALCSKAWSDATYLDEIPGQFRERLTDQMKRDVNEKALEYSRQAMEVGPEASLPHVAACISMGRLALLSENKAKVRLAKEAREHAVHALEKEPDSDLAHHLMGRWHWEMAQLNVVVRTLIRIAFGTALPSGSHQNALESYSNATRLAPARLIHRVELGRAYHKLGRRKEAWRELEAAVTLDAEDINAHLQKADAELLLKGLRRDARRHKWALHSAESSPGGGGRPEGGERRGEWEGGQSRWPRLRLPERLTLPGFQLPGLGPQAAVAGSVGGAPEGESSRQEV